MKPMRLQTKSLTCFPRQKPDLASESKFYRSTTERRVMGASRCRLKNTAHEILATETAAWDSHKRHMFTIHYTIFNSLSTKHWQ